MQWKRPLVRIVKSQDCLDEFLLLISFRYSPEVIPGSCLYHTHMAILGHNDCARERLERDVDHHLLLLLSPRLIVVVYWLLLLLHCQHHHIPVVDVMT